MCYVAFLPLLPIRILLSPVDSAIGWKANVASFEHSQKHHLMTNNKPSKVLHITLWIVQGLLAASLVWAGALKLFQSGHDLSAMWPWTGEIAPWLVKLTGVLDLSAAAGLVLPGVLGIRPALMPLAAIGLVLLMLAAGLFHIARGEAPVIGVNVIFGIMAAFVAWGRFRRA